MYKFVVVSGSSDGEDPVKFHKAAGSWTEGLLVLGEMLIL